jgi:hypothetical protein
MAASAAFHRAEEDEVVAVVEDGVELRLLAVAAGGDLAIPGEPASYCERVLRSQS